MKMIQDLKQKGGTSLIIAIMETIAGQSTVKFNTEIVKPFLCDYSDAYILVTGNIIVENGNDATSSY